MKIKKYGEYSLPSYLEDLAANANEEGKTKRNIIYVQKQQTASESKIYCAD